VTYATWAATEAAIEALNGTFTFPGAGQPIMVKLADAKPQDMQRVGAKRGIDVMGGGEFLACEFAVRFCFVFRGVVWVWVCMGRAFLCMGRLGCAFSLACHTVGVRICLLRGGEVRHRRDERR
jgi:hypothetical protein